MKLMRGMFIMLIFGGIILLNSCASDLVISENKSINGSWDKNDSVRFDFQINDTTSLYNFQLNIRNTTEYAYRNIYFFVQTEFPNGNISSDTIECILADIRGKWYGNGMGNIKENNIQIRQNLKFPVQGIYHMSFVQAMREDKLNGISDIGIQISKSSEN